MEFQLSLLVRREFLHHKNTQSQRVLKRSHWPSAAGRRPDRRRDGHRAVAVATVYVVAVFVLVVVVVASVAGRENVEL